MGKIKKEYIVLGVIIIVSLFFLVVKKSDQVNYSLPEFSKIKVEAIAKVEIVKKDSRIQLQQEGKQWKVGEQGYPADIAKVDKIKDLIAGLEITELISRAENYDRYGLNESEKLEIAVKDDEDKVLREFVVGNASATNQHTYIKLKDDKNVYHARESFKTEFNQSIEDFRDKKVLKYEKGEIADLTIQYDKTSMILKKTVSKEAGKKVEGKEQPAPQVTKVIWKDQNGTEMKEDEVNAIFDKTSDLSCTKYLTDAEVQELISEDKLLYSLKLKGTSDYELKFYHKKDKDANDYPVVSSQNKYPFFLSAYVADGMMKKEKDLKPEEKKEEKK